MQWREGKSGRVGMSAYFNGVCIRANQVPGAENTDSGRVGGTDTRVRAKGDKRKRGAAGATGGGDART